MVNKVILIGSLGQDPEIRYSQDGTAVANFSIATTEKWKGKDGQTQETTEWHRIVLWKRLAELAGEYLTKGSKVFVEGKLKTRKWKDQQGNDRYTTEIQGHEIKFLSPRNNSGNAGGHDGYPDPAPVGDDVPF